MKKYSLVRKYSTIGVIFLFMGTSIVPSIQSEFPIEKNIITVDDEPGDADFTSIKEAVNASSPGDTIEVYSGTYPEQEICIVKDNVTLLGIAHELGAGNDSGKPLIQGYKSGRILRVEASYVTVSNFRIEHPGAFDSVCIWVSDQQNITLTECSIHNSKKAMNEGIQAGDCDNIKIINNDISNCSRGISSGAHNPGSLTITGNVITDCLYEGIDLYCDQQNVSGNRIKRCGYGIRISGTGNTIYGNDIESCPVGVYDPDSDYKHERGNTITKNNFKNYSRDARDAWWNRAVVLYFIGLYLSNKDTWIGNYWDTWIGVGPHRILGWLVVGIAFVFYESGIGFIIPWFEYDRHPVKQPYDIPGFT